GGSARRAERPEQPTLACTRTAADMLERPAHALRQTAPLALLVAEPAKAGIRTARQSVIGELVDPLCGSALRRQVTGSRPREHRHRGQRKWKRAHWLLSTLALQQAILRNGSCDYDRKLGRG